MPPPSLPINNHRRRCDIIYSLVPRSLSLIFKSVKSSTPKFANDVKPDSCQQTRGWHRRTKSRRAPVGGRPENLPLAARKPLTRPADDSPPTPDSRRRPPDGHTPPSQQHGGSLLPSGPHLRCGVKENALKNVCYFIICSKFARRSSAGLV